MRRALVPGPVGDADDPAVTVSGDGRSCVSCCCGSGKPADELGDLVIAGRVYPPQGRSVGDESGEELSDLLGLIAGSASIRHERDVHPASGLAGCVLRPCCRSGHLG